MVFKEYIKSYIKEYKLLKLEEMLLNISQKELLNEKKVSVDKLVDKLMKNDTFKEKAREYLNDKDAYNSWASNLDGKKYSKLDNQSQGSKRRTVTQRLKDEKINYAPLAYKLWPEMSEDAARSWFSKKVSGKNESFSDDEISKLYNLLNNII
jgi:ClpP class serine protease